jgi:hypothetical protein
MIKLIYKYSYYYIHSLFHAASLYKRVKMSQASIIFLGKIFSEIAI